VARCGRSARRYVTVAGETVARKIGSATRVDDAAARSPMRREAMFQRLISRIANSSRAAADGSVQRRAQATAAEGLSSGTPHGHSVGWRRGL
jgi:hypothetical protein